MWLPINGGACPAIHFPSGDVAVKIDLGQAPKGRDLLDWQQFERDLDLAQAVDLGFAPISVSEQSDHRTIVLDALKCVDENNVRWGVGLRFVLEAWTVSGSVKATIALVAAQASLNLAYTRASFDTLGIDPSLLSGDLPGFEEMSVSSYGDLMKAIDACRSDILKASPDELTPRPVAVLVEAPMPAAGPEQHHRWWPRIR